MKHELCPACESYGRCLLKIGAKKAAKAVPPLEDQELMFPGVNQVTTEAFNAWEKIERLKEIAKQRGCLNWKSANPIYPGKYLVEVAVKEIRLQHNQRNQPQTYAK